MQQNPLTNRTSPAARRPRRRGTVYLVVIGAAMIVSIIGLSAITVARLQLRMARTADAVSEADLLALSAIEQAVTVLESTPGWRSVYTHDTWEPDQPWGAGFFKWKLVADSGDLQTPPDGDVRIVGYGQVGDAIQQRSVYVVDSGATLQEGTWIKV